MIFWNIDFSNTIFVKRPFLILVDEFCPGWIRIRITLTPVETSLFYIFWKVTPHVSSWFVSAYNIGTFHWPFGRFSSPNAKLSASFPNHLGEVTRARWKSTASEIIARITDFVVPKRNFQNFFYLNEKKRKEEKSKCERDNMVHGFAQLILQTGSSKSEVCDSVSAGKDAGNLWLTEFPDFFILLKKKKILTSWDFSISRDIALTDPPISVQESNVIENYHARQKNSKMEKRKMRKKDEEANGTWMAAKSNSMTHLHLLKLINP